MRQILLICPLEKEVRPLLGAFASLGFNAETDTSLKLPVFRIPAKGFVIARGGHGKTQFGIQTQYLITHLRDLDGVICVGAGGGLAPHLKVGDVVIAEKTIEHDYTERFFPRPRPEFLAHPSLLDRFRVREHRFDFDVHYGSVAGGDEDIVDLLRAEELHLSTSSLAVAWEGTGGARAALFNELPFLEIRAITDNARDSVEDSFAKNLGRCMKNVAELLNAVL